MKGYQLTDRLNHAFGLKGTAGRDVMLKDKEGNYYVLNDVEPADADDSVTWINIRKVDQ